MSTCIIIDDEPHCSGTIQLLLKSSFPQIEVLSICSNGLTGHEAIERLGPDLIYLDIAMPKVDGFEMLNRIQDRSFEIIFTTAYDNYALKAFKVNAIDYLLKPIIKEEFIEATTKAIEKIEAKSRKVNVHDKIHIDRLLEYIRSDQVASQRIAIPTLQGFKMINISDITYITADGNYSSIFISNGKPILVTQLLKSLERQLQDHKFIRIHRNTLVNSMYIDRYVKGEGGYVILTNSMHLDVSRRKKNKLFRFFDNKRK